MSNRLSDGKFPDQKDAPSGDPFHTPNSTVEYKGPNAESGAGQVGNFAENPYGPDKP
jgi:hypothetical protein